MNEQGRHPDLIELQLAHAKRNKVRAAYNKAQRLRLQLGRLDAACGPEDMNLAGWRLHSLKGELSGHWAVWVDENWRLTFKFHGIDTELVDYQDYH